MKVGLCVTQAKMGKLGWDLSTARTTRHLSEIFSCSEVFSGAVCAREPDVLVLKVTDQLAAECEGDAQAGREVRNVEAYLRDHPRVRVVDPVALQRNFFQRDALCGALLEASRTGGYLVPRHATVGERSDDAEVEKSLGGVTFPALCKPVSACGTNAAHVMWIVFGVEGVRQYRAAFPGCAFVCQEFLDHDALLFKVFCCAGRTIVQRRPSLPNIRHLPATTAPLVFDNQKPVGPQILSWNLPTPSQSPVPAPPAVPDSVLCELGREVSKAFGGAKLFGADVIRDSRTGSLAVIDVNYFPSFKGCLTASEFFDEVLDSIHADEGKCSFFIRPKHRSCNLPRIPGGTFCHSHAPDPTAVPCPKDPKHKVPAADLERHLARCPGTAASKSPSSPFYSLGINSGASNGECAVGQKDAPLWSDQELVLRVANRLRTLSAGTLQVRDPPLEQLRDEEAERVERETSRSAEGSHKHTPQESSLIAHLRRCGALESGTAFVELGSGKGKLAALVARCLPPDSPTDKKMVLVDRQRFSSRSEVTAWNGAVRDTGRAVKVERVQMDVADLDLASLVSTEGHVVCFAKHLCGSGSDVALRAVVVASNRLRDRGTKFTVLLALCCFHRCTWSDYTNVQYLRQSGLATSRQEFDVLKKMAVWTTDKDPTPASKAPPPESADADRAGYVEFSADERKELGRLARFALTTGREQYLRANGFTDVQVVQYVTGDVSPENLLLIAHRL